MFGYTLPNFEKRCIQNRTLKNRPVNFVELLSHRLSNFAEISYVDALRVCRGCKIVKFINRCIVKTQND